MDCRRVVGCEPFESGEHFSFRDLLTCHGNKPLSEEQRASGVQNPTHRDLSLPKRGLKPLPVIVIGPLSLVIAELKSNIDSLEKDLEYHSDIPEDDYLGIFDNDKNTDAMLTVQHIEAFKMVLSFYSGESTLF